MWANVYQKQQFEYSYTLVVCKITQEKDLGVTVDSLMETSTQCPAVVRKANKVSGYITDGLENNTGNNNNTVKYLNKLFFILRLVYFAFFNWKEIGITWKRELKGI